MTRDLLQKFVNIFEHYELKDAILNTLRPHEQQPFLRLIADSKAAVKDAEPHQGPGQQAIRNAIAVLMTVEAIHQATYGRDEDGNVDRDAEPEMSAADIFDAVHQLGSVQDTIEDLQTILEPRAIII